MAIRNDLTGKKYGKLEVLGIALDEPYKKKKWLCRCECGNEVTVAGSNLQSGHSTKCKSCQLKEIQLGNKKHGQTASCIYKVWREMLNRCENKKDKSYGDYGARGICVCAEWHSSENFIAWAYANGYKLGLQIDRIDVNGSYGPKNCRWVTRIENANNKRNNVYIKYAGETKTLAEWARYFNLDYKALHKNVRVKGYSLETAVRKLKKCVG